VKYAKRFRSGQAGAQQAAPLQISALRVAVLVACVCFALVVADDTCGGQVQSAAKEDKAPVVAKVEPPNWWVGLTPEVMVLVSGRGLDANKVDCNLSSVTVERTQASAGGKYLFVWLKFGADLKSGTLVCRATNADGGVASFELPISSRIETIHRFQGVTPEDVIYLIMPDRFANGDPNNDEPEGDLGSHDRAKARAYHGGDLRGIREHLDYLKSLGVTTLWLTPVVKNGAAEDYHGYGAVDLYAVDPHLGTLRDYQELINAAHTQKMKVLFDIVPNHVGPKHPWAANPPLADWFHGTVAKHINSSMPVDPASVIAPAAAFYGEPKEQAFGHDPFEAMTDPHAPPSLWRYLTDGWFFGVLPDLNTENPIVATYLQQNAIWWAESSGLDGFRIDTFPYVPRIFWSRWHATLKKIYPRLTTIGEVYHPDPSVTSFFAGGERRFDGVDSGVTTVFDYPTFFALRDVLSGKVPAAKLANVMRHDSLYVRPDQLVTFFGNHDTTRFAGAGGPAGGGAGGADLTKLKLAFGLNLTLRGIPQLYYGDEIGMPGGGDPDNRRDFPGGWSEDSKNAFTENGRTTEQQQVFSFVKNLLGVRREHPALSEGSQWNLLSDDSGLVFLRESDEERVLVAFNLSKSMRELRVPVSETPAAGAVGSEKLTGDARIEIGGKGIVVSAPAESISIFLLN
jgi:neopullulanase